MVGGVCAGRDRLCCRWVRSFSFSRHTDHHLVRGHPQRGIHRGGRFAGGPPRGDGVSPRDDPESRPSRRGEPALHPHLQRNLVDDAVPRVVHVGSVSVGSWPDEGSSRRGSELSRAGDSHAGGELERCRYANGRYHRATLDLRQHRPDPGLRRGSDGQPCQRPLRSAETHCAFGGVASPQQRRSFLPLRALHGPALALQRSPSAPGSVHERTRGSRDHCRVSRFLCQP